jgi:hypothetical protein
MDQTAGSLLRRELHFADRINHHESTGCQASAALNPELVLLKPDTQF